MKNIHVLPTEKPSRLIFNSFHKSFCYQKEIDGMYINDGKVSGADFWGLQKALNNGFKPQNIYITSDEEIKEGDWVITPTNDIIQWAKVFQPDGKKIILTTDQDLIKDSVQAIDDEFLEWFVKNPSCEWVEVEEYYSFEIGDWTYKIIVPRTTQQIIDEDFDGGLTMGQIIPKEEAKQETLEEFIQTQLSLGKYQDQESAIRHSIELGAKWQAERICDHTYILTSEQGHRVIKCQKCSNIQPI